MRIEFKAKIRTARHMDGSHAYDYAAVPKFMPKHCDMAAARNHPKYGCLANSTLFPGVLAGVRRRYFPSGEVRLDRLPEGVTVDTSGYLAVVTIEVP